MRAVVGRLDEVGAQDAARVLRARRRSPSTSPGATSAPEQREAVFEGEGTWTGGKYPGVRAWFKYLETRTYKMHVRVLLARYRAYDPCQACGGKRLAPASLLYHVDGLDLAAWHGLELASARARLGGAGDRAPGRGRSPAGS